MEKKFRIKPKIFIFLFTIICMISFIYLSYSLYLLTGIETVIRYACITILGIINIIIYILALRSCKKRKVIKHIMWIIILLIFTIGQGYLGYFIHSAYSSVSNMTKNSLIYETSVVVMKGSSITDIDDVKNKKIGYLNDPTSIDNNILAEAIIEEKNLDKNNQVLKYDELNTLIADLYNDDLDLILITSNYVNLFGDSDEDSSGNTNPYKNIKDETKIIYNKQKKYTKEEIEDIEGNPLTNSTTTITDPFTILVMGIDSTSSTLNKNAIGNGDALIIITFNPKTFNATILSIPRDTYVPISCNSNREKKINSAAYGGITCMINTIQNFLNIKINHYVKINFKGVVKLVEALGGVDINVPYSFCEQNSSRQWGKNTIYVNKGLQHLNGEQALALARNRKTNTRCSKEWNQGTRNDYVRGQNQQLVIQAIINKTKTINSPGQMLNILDTVSKSIDTSFSTEQILSFYTIAKDIIKTSAVESSNVITLQRLYLSGRTQCIYEEGLNKDIYKCQYNEIPNKNSVKAIQNAMNANLGGSNSLIKTFDFSANETYTPTIIGKNAGGVTLYTLLGSFLNSTKAQAEIMCNSKKITCSFKYATVTDANKVGKVIDQSYNQYKRVDRITSASPLTLTIGQEKITTTTTTVSTIE